MIILGLLVTLLAILYSSYHVEMVVAEKDGRTDRQQCVCRRDEEREQNHSEEKSIMSCQKIFRKHNGWCSTLSYFLTLVRGDERPREGLHFPSLICEGMPEVT